MQKYGESAEAEENVYIVKFLNKKSGGTRIWLSKWAKESMFFEKRCLLIEKFWSSP